MEEFPTDMKTGALGYTNDFSWRNDPLGAVRICGMTADWAAQQSQRSQIFRNSSILNSIFTYRYNFYSSIYKVTTYMVIHMVLYPAMISSRVLDGDREF